MTFARLRERERGEESNLKSLILWGPYQVCPIHSLEEQTWTPQELHQTEQYVLDGQIALTNVIISKNKKKLNGGKS